MRRTRHAVTATLVVGALLAAVVLSFTGAASAAALDYSTDRDIPTAVDQAPEGFEPLGDPTVDTDNCIATSRQLFSLTRVEGGEPAVEETFSFGWEERTRTFVPGTAEVSHQEYKYVRYGDVIEKQVRGNVETRIRGDWDVTGTFDWVDYPSAGPVNDDGRARSGSHNDIFDQTGNGNGSTRKHSTQYRYVVVGQFVKEGPTGWRTSPPAGSGWVQVDQRKVVDSAAVPASYTPWSNWGGGAIGLTEQATLPANTDVHEYRQLAPVSNNDGRPAVEGTPVTYFVQTTSVTGEACPTTTVTVPDTTTSTTLPDCQVRTYHGFLPCPPVTTVPPTPTTTVAAPTVPPVTPQISATSTVVPPAPLPNCDELGLSNILADEPEFRADLDADRDGVACEIEELAFTGVGKTLAWITVIGFVLIVAGLACYVFTGKPVKDEDGVQVEDEDLEDEVV